MADAPFHNSLLVAVPVGQGETVRKMLRESVETGGVQALLGGTASGVVVKERGADDVVLDFDTQDAPMLDDRMLPLAERVAFHWDAGRGTVLHNIFTYPEGHPGAEPEKKPNEDGRAFGDIVVAVTFRDGPSVSTFSNTLPEWGVEVDRW